MICTFTNDRRGLVSLLLFLCLAIPANGEEAIDFSRDIRPLLSDNCFACHGFDEGSREAGLRLDTREGAVADLGGYAAIVPGDPDASELLVRIKSKDPDALMPPADSHKDRLSAEAIAKLERWISDGAQWGAHWAFEMPQAIARSENTSHPIDYFVQKRLALKELDLAPSAEVHTLARRLAFDLTGLPPTEEAMKRLGETPTESDWQKWIDELLASPAHGERMAMWWLDGARYADTDGFQQDSTRENWPWRDWVVDAFNQNMPFDQFTIEQFAGDLLPDATDEQVLATCFHRNHMHNGEGGRDPAESRVDYVLDRTNTMGTLWLGLTLGCTQCHDHKFDPISQKEYYSLTAFFDSIDESGAAGGGAKPFMSYRSPHTAPAIAEAKRLEQQLEAALQQVQQDAEPAFQKQLQKWHQQAKSGFQAWHPIRATEVWSTEGTKLTPGPEGHFDASDQGHHQDDYHLIVKELPLARVTGVRLQVLADPAHTDGKYSFADSGEFILTNFKLQVRNRRNGDLTELPLRQAAASQNGTGKDKKYGNVSGTLDDDPRTGWTTRTKPVDAIQQAVFELQDPLILREDEQLEIIMMQRSLAPRELIAKFTLSLTDQRGKAVRSLKPMPMERLAQSLQAADKTKQPADPSPDEGSPKQDATASDLPENMAPELVKDFREQFLLDDVRWQKADQRHQRAVAQRRATEKAGGELLVTVLKERAEPRQTHVLLRGVWDQHGEVVPPGFPTAIPSQQNDAPKQTAYDRLALAKWLVSKENPLTARVIVNQVWQLFFGAGLVRTPGDFGLQGESPTHPDLLDWLAVDFMDHDWDLKHLVKRIVTSRTYRQSSEISPSLLQDDPENRWLARGARFRLPSWMIRDACLQQSGLLNPIVGGPPVFPYQPPGIWQDQFMGRFTYKPTIGPGQYRRTLYAFWRRSSAPTFLFDNAMRRTCEVIPRRTNTPLQALVLMNNLTAQEAARHLADNLLSNLLSKETNDAKLMTKIYQRILQRPPTDTEITVLEETYTEAFAYYQEHPDDAMEFVTVGQLPAPQSNPVRLAATTLVVGLVFNLDEAITHE